MTFEAVHWLIWSHDTIVCCVHVMKVGARIKKQFFKFLISCYIYTVLYFSMELTRVVFVFILLLFSIYLSTIDSCEIYKSVESEDHALEGHVITTIVRSLVSVCWAKCAALSWCFSINVRPTNHGTIECDLNNSSKRANPGSMVPRQGSQYHEYGVSIAVT
jgi:hypothetical protein